MHGENHIKQLSIIPLSLVLLAILSLNFQGTAFAASFKGSLGGKHVTTMAPNCVVAVRKSKVTPDCTPYPRCTASGCYNLDPYAEGCGTATTYNHISYVQTAFGGSFSGQPWFTYGYITNYYSSWCVANWAVVSLTQTGYNASVITSLWIRTTDAKGHNEEMCFPNDCNASYYGPTYPTWTNMIDGTKKTYAYVDANVGTGASLDPFPAEADQ